MMEDLLKIILDRIESLEKRIHRLEDRVVQLTSYSNLLKWVIGLLISLMVFLIGLVYKGG